MPVSKWAISLTTSYSSSQRGKKVGVLGRRFTFHDASHINTRHGITCFHTLPDNHHVFAIGPYCRSAIPHPIVFDAGHVLRLTLGLILASVLTGR
jgi:hypothetical protein